uniref:Uncharacterized protein n=1 Tax=Arundo donax TaxID=35708 RepID=A0A0A9CES3_ARUDO
MFENDQETSASQILAQYSRKLLLILVVPPCHSFLDVLIFLARLEVRYLVEYSAQYVAYITLVAHVDPGLAVE